MIKVSGVGRDGKVYPLIITIGEHEYTKVSKDELKQRGFVPCDGIYKNSAGEIVPPSITEAILNPETDPVELDRRRVFADTDEINTSL